MAVCTFFGHRDCPDQVKGQLQQLLKDLIQNQSVNRFYVGNQGHFDALVLHTLRKLKTVYPHISYFVVLAYLPIKRAEFDTTDYSHTIYPDGLENTPKRFAIVRRNRWMIEQADVVVTYIVYTTGGAVQFKELAEKKGKRVINLPDQSFFDEGVF